MEFIKNRILGIIERLPDFDSDAVLYAFIAGLITGWVWYAIAGQVWNLWLRWPSYSNVPAPMISLWKISTRGLVACWRVTPGPVATARAPTLPGACPRARASAGWSLKRLCETVKM